jgi:hypothetical protein
MEVVKYQLIDGTGAPYCDSGAGVVKLPSTAIVFDFMESVFEHNKSFLKLFSATQLWVYERLSDFEKKEPSVDIMSPISVLSGLSEVIVRVPVLLTPKAHPKHAEHVAKLERYTFFTVVENHKGCVTAFSRRRLATFAHGIHRCLQKTEDTRFPFIVYSLETKETYKVGLLHECVSVGSGP